MARSRERGQAVPLLTIVLMLAALAAVVVAEIGVAAVERSRAQTAADAASLAGAAEGRPAAEAAATANGATLIDYAEEGRRVEVEVHYRRARARAAAESAAATGPSADVGGGDRDGLAPAVAAALARADQLLGRPVPVVSGFRTRAEQQALWDARASNPFPVAPPGRSRHESGLAIDVPSGFVAALLGVADDAGLCQPLPETDPVHFEPCPPIRT